MKKALMIAYQFPPMGGSGVQRTTKFVKYLQNFGWEPIVFTREVKNMSLKDESLLKDIPDNTNIIRTAPWDFTELPGVFSLPGKFLGRKVLIPDAERVWESRSKKIAEKAIREQAIDLIYTTSYPYSDHLMGLYLKDKYPNIPWVADFRDEWINNPYLLDNPHNNIRMNIEKKMEAQVLENADVLITNTPVMMKNFVKNDKTLESKFYVIPNGYDEEDFKNYSQVIPNNSKFTLTYTGALYGRRKPDTFFESIRQLIESDAIEREKMYVKLIGNFKVSQLQSLISKYTLDGVVEIMPYMQHEECIRHLLMSDALVLIEGSGPGSEAFYTGKVFEYMNTTRPILAVIPAKGAAAQIINETETGYVSDCTDVEKTKENLLTLYNSWITKQSVFSPNWDKIQKFERKSLTKDLADLFNKSISKMQTSL